MCITEKAPTAWHRRGTLKTGNTYNQPNRPSTVSQRLHVQLVQFCLAFPRRHDYLETRHALPALLLQQFAWTEADVAPRRSAWQSALGPAAAATAAESAVGRHSAAGSPQSTVAPLFCFETAIKLFFWSVLVYAYQEEADTVSLAAMPAAIREVLGEMDAAMRLYGLRKRRLFYDRACGTKALVAWSDSVIVLSFRGTAEMVNFIQDAKVWYHLRVAWLHATSPTDSPCQPSVSRTGSATSHTAPWLSSVTGPS